MDTIAGRLRALIHFDVSGSWKTAEQLESVASKDIGLVDYEDLYTAKRMAKLTSVGGDSSSSSNDAPAPKTAKKKKKKRGKGKKKTPEGGKKNE